MAVKRNKVGKTGKQNRNAGKHPSYKKRKMSAEQIRKKRARDKAYNAKPKNTKKRSEDNRERKKLGLKVGDKRDASLKTIVKKVKGKVKKVKKYVAEHRSKNRGSKSNSDGDKRARGGKKGAVTRSTKRRTSKARKAK